MKSVTVIGGSISGCLAALVLGRQGYAAEVFELSNASLVDRGAAVAIPTDIFARLKQLDLIDQDTPHLNHKAMRYRHASQARGDYELMVLPTDIVALRWGHLYQQLRKRIPDKQYHPGLGAEDIEQTPENVTVTMNDGRLVSSDIAVAADGAYSRCRDMVCSAVQRNNSGYVLWRGLLEERHWINPEPHEGVSWSLFDRGLAGAYFIANESGGSKPGQRTLNWGIYNSLSSAELMDIQPELATGRNAVHQIGSKGKAHLRYLAENHLTAPLGEAVLATTRPFIQTITDVLPPRLTKGRVALVGDAAGVLRPHSASGITKAVQNVFALAQNLEQTSDLKTALSTWEEQQLHELGAHSRLSRRLGDGLVCHAPNWNTMTSENMAAWWDGLMSETAWYADARD